MCSLESREYECRLTFKIASAVTTSLERSVEEIFHYIPAHYKLRAGGIGVDAGPGLAGKVTDRFLEAGHGPFNAHGAGCGADNPGDRRKPGSDPVHNTDADFDGSNVRTRHHIGPRGAFILRIIRLDSRVVPLVLCQIRENVRALAGFGRHFHRLAHDIHGG